MSQGETVGGQPRKMTFQTHCNLGYKNGRHEKSCLHHLDITKFLTEDLKKNQLLGIQTGRSQDQVSHLWNLILAPVCLQLFKSD